MSSCFPPVPVFDPTKLRIEIEKEKDYYDMYKVRVKLFYDNELVSESMYWDHT